MLLPKILTKPTLFLFLELMLLSACVITGSFYDTNGLLSPDSTNYLALANSLLNDHDFFVSGYGFSGNEKDYFAIWPVGYPLVIALIAKISGLGVFWASKLSNIIFAALSFIILKLLFKSTAYIYGLLFLSAAALTIHSFSWSESFFIFCLLGYSSSLVYAIKYPTALEKYLSLTLCFAIGLFLARYIGAFSTICTGLIGLFYLYTKKPKQAYWFLFIALLNAAFVALYLHHNITLSGYLTGQPRVTAPEDNVQLFIQTLTALFALLIIPIPDFFMGVPYFVIVIMQLLCFFYFCKNNKSPITKTSCSIPVLFSFIGISYLLAIISLRWLTQFDELNSRLLFPGAILILIAGLRFLETNNLPMFNNIKKALIVMITLTQIFFYLVIIFAKPQLSYADNIKKIQKDYADIPSGSIVVSGNTHIKYLREDILLWSPWSTPYNKDKETWSNFLTRSQSRAIYIAAPLESFIKKEYDSTVIEEIKKAGSVNDIPKKYSP